MCVLGWGADCWTPHCRALCPQEPDQVYEGITFDDFLKVGVRWRGRAVGRGGGSRGPWSGGDWCLCGKGTAFKTM